MVEDKDGKKVNVPKKRPMKIVEKNIQVGPFHIFKLRAIHKREIPIDEWRNRHANLKAEEDEDYD